MADTKTTTNNVNVQITSIKLKGNSNYLLWAQAVCVYIMAKDKLSYITSAPPALDSKDYSTWVKENAIILIWLWNNMEPDIAASVMFHMTAKGTDKSLQEYYSAFKGIVEELNVFQPLTTDIEKLKAQWNEFFVSKFLAGLSPSLKAMKGHLLAGESVSTLNDTYSRLQCIASPSSKPDNTPPKENSAFTTSGGHGRDRNLGGGRGAGGRGSGGQHIAKAAWQCSYCGKLNHTIETCWSKHGKIEWAQHLANHAAPEDGTNIVSSSESKSSSSVMADSSTTLCDEVHQLEPHKESRVIHFQYWGIHFHCHTGLLFFPPLLHPGLLIPGLPLT
ncbi:uncharacterized protein LOC122643479 [Telopea speciosissima]|uniref:uncharacterized protein LOC122643479 n=1 Tax=Telopea speciosissima TaxID=54955 RepID=UPI001CC76748|nr:uncharacterized protein LOC122643479 [Telopea speciosissima]